MLQKEVILCQPQASNRMSHIVMEACLTGFVESEGYQPHDSLVAALLRESAYRHLR
jgi:hypothetical protein